jgi:hypothetical protein
LWVSPALLLLAGRSSGQSVLHVPADYPTIQAAVAAASNGDTVLVAPGIYYEKVNLLTKQITVASEEGPEATIIDGSQGPPPGAIFAQLCGFPCPATISGFTIRNSGGGGISAELQAHLTITGCVIENNVSCGGGGGIRIINSAVLVVGNVIQGNSEGLCSNGNGGGIDISSGAPVQILDNLISFNSCTNGGGIGMSPGGPALIRGNRFIGNTGGNGGAIYMANESNPVIVQNVFFGNSASATGGGIRWSIPSWAIGPTIVNNTVVGNSSAQGAALWGEGFDTGAQVMNNILTAPAGQMVVYLGPWGDPAIPVFKNNDVFPGLLGFAYVGSVPNLTGVNGNISVDPQFRDPANGDWHLSPDSPCVDAGFAAAPALPATDADGDPRVTDGDGDGVAIVDIGWDEFSPVRAFGSGCPSAGGLLPALAPGGGSPVVGNGAFGITLSNSPAGTPVVLIFGDSADSWQGVPLPFSLAFLGFPGCALLVAADALAIGMTGGAGGGAGVALFPIPVPAEPALSGLHLFFQGFVGGPSSVPAVASMTAGLEVTVL